MNPGASEKAGLEGDVYYPIPEAVAQTYIPDWEATAARADQDTDRLLGRAGQNGMVQALGQRAR